MCQPDWVTGFPDSWLNIILGVSLRINLKDISIWIGELSKADGPPHSAWASSKPEQNKKMEEGRICWFSAWLLELGHVFSFSQSSWFPCLHTGTGIYTIGSPALRHSNYTTGFPKSPACKWQIMGLLNFLIATWANTFISPPFSLSLKIYTLWLCFSGEA